VRAQLHRVAAVRMPVESQPKRPLASCVITTKRQCPGEKNLPGASHQLLDAITENALSHGPTTQQAQSAKPEQRQRSRLGYRGGGQVGATIAQRSTSSFCGKHISDIV